MLEFVRTRKVFVLLIAVFLFSCATAPYMDRQEAKLRQQLQGTGVSVTRKGNGLILNMPAHLTFELDQSDIKSNFYEILNSIAVVLKKEFRKASICIIGHTDSTGSLEHNITLSEKRAESVAEYLKAQGIHPQRLFTWGRGPQDPVASNDNPTGQALNRRVELTLVPHAE
jgi:outer membrane protein OmpA-like peptidoglycan-associated protein